MWQVPAYGQNSPGELYASLFGSVVSPVAGHMLIDFGCGKGVGGQTLYNMYGLNITYLDIVKVEGCPEPHIQQSLWAHIKFIGKKHWDYGYCVDVMEHLPKEFTMLAVRNMLNVCKKGVFFIISFLPDTCGPMHLGTPLHLTTEDFTWWRDRFMEVGTLIDGRDLLSHGVYYVKN